MFLNLYQKSSTTLQILLHLNIVYTLFWEVIEIICFVFKRYNLIYPTNAFGIELSMTFLLILNEFVRQFFGIKGNLTQRVSLLIIFLIFNACCALGFVFFLIWQSYVQRVEIILSSIALLFILTETIFTIVTIIRLKIITKDLTVQQKIDKIKEARDKFQQTKND
ncbi:unnamed protein product [Didymodactylos carnosus]|uniref:Transmembrane protein n=1 Tax=Didymodactylos carnosus TaxID=1234261 RepID=A0A815F2A1_9BILA|nr:unnamed protein product [Didymodactylos carnosus]CAF1320265.1 unnamed protein product [Didymodactylos carnosus]CAF3874793.1 unnamed protein product [Didymodactylos carnosus]CAF4165326.1 unnamed protein product [Didymodactylos carnosus]